MTRAFTTIIIWGILITAFFTLTISAFTGFLGVKRDMAKHNGTYGSIKNVDFYADFDFFDLNVDDAIFYPRASGGYEFAIEYKKAIAFNGTTNKYNLLVNNTPSLTTSNAARLSGIWKQSFFDFDGLHICDITFNIHFVFMVNKTTLSIETNVSEKDFGFLVQYVAVNGLKLRIITEQYNTPQLVEVPA